jgi:chromosome partitioning protein
MPSDLRPQRRNTATVDFFRNFSNMPASAKLRLGVEGIRYRTGGLSRHSLDTEWEGHPASTMDTTAQRGSLHKIVILNPKGGCGKTTLATNLASYFATHGPPPTLVDCDPRGYSMRWLDKRPGFRPKIYGIAAENFCNQTDKRYQLHAWPGSTYLILDLPAALSSDQLFDQTYDANSILIPVVPSEIDIYAAASFIADLLLFAQLDRRNRNLAIIANRTRQNTRSYRMLMRFLTSLEIPIVSELRDSQNYVYAAANGIGIAEMPAYRARKDVEQLELIVSWIERWRMRQLDAAATARFRHVPGTGVLTPAASKGH